MTRPRVFLASLIVAACAGLFQASIAESAMNRATAPTGWLAFAAAEPGLPPATQPTIAVSSECSYSATQFGLGAGGFRPGEKTTVEVMPTSDPLAGMPMTTDEITASAVGHFVALLDVPATAARSPIIRSVRVRPSPPRPGGPALLATARLKTVSRGVSVQPAGQVGRAGGQERWHLTGLPEGTQLWAHYRRGGAIATVALATAEDPCGQARFALRTLPAGRERPGRWDVWITTSRIFRPRRDEIYAQRSMTVTGRGADARIKFGPLRSQLVARDRRVVAPPTHFFAADATQIGVVGAIFGDTGGAPVSFFERIGDRLKALGSARAAPGKFTILDDMTTWSCSRSTRRFMAFAKLADGFQATGVNTIRTPSCANRFQIGATLRGRAGREIVVRVADRWGTGAIAPRLCVTPPNARTACRRLPFPRAVAITSRRLAANRAGLWRIDLRVRGTHTRTAIRVGGRRRATKPIPVLLATGDSMMFGIDSFLSEELAGAVEIRSDVRPGTGISKRLSDWPMIASAQARAQHPQITVIMIGAADGFPMTTPGGASLPCCEQPWIAEYARRARVMMDSYRRRGRGRVYWLTVPTPRGAERLPVTAAVNAAIRAAASGVSGVTVVGLDVLFTPHGYREVVRYRGRNVRVRNVDGLHLNLQGQAIAAKVVAQMIRQQR